MDRRGAQYLARAITQHPPPDPVCALRAKPEHLGTSASGRPEDTHGWAVRVATSSGAELLIVDAGHLLRDLDNAERQWRSVTEFVAFACGALAGGRPC